MPSLLTDFWNQMCFNLFSIIETFSHQWVSFLLLKFFLLFHMLKVFNYSLSVNSFNFFDFSIVRLQVFTMWLNLVLSNWVKLLQPLLLPFWILSFVLLNFTVNFPLFFNLWYFRFRFCMIKFFLQFLFSYLFFFQLI